MRVRPIKLLFSFFLVLGISSVILFNNSNRTRKVETFLKVFPKKQFLSKIKQDKPMWVEDQINDDLSFFEENKISQQALDATYKLLKQNSVKKQFIRYRIVNNKLFRHFPSDENLSKKEPPFERAIKTLTQVARLPDIDFIYSDMDGTPEFYMAKDFFVTEDKNLQAPLLSRAKLEDLQYVVLIPDFYSVDAAWEKDANAILEFNKKNLWENKKDLAFWRGGSHDKGYTIENYDSKPRIIISKLSKEHPELLDAGIVMTPCIQLEKKIKEDDLIKKHASMFDHLGYKYQPVMDGYSCTYPGYQWRLISNSVCFKQQSNDIQWFYGALKPYEHYIPVENNMSDLLEKIIWAKNSDTACKHIAENATNFVLNNLMMEDVYSYIYNLFKEYSKHQSFSKRDLKNDMKNDSNWICIQNRRHANKVIANREL